MLKMIASLLTIVMCSGFLVKLSHCECPDRRQADVHQKFTRIDHSTRSAGADCKWKLPEITSSGHAVMYFVKDVSLKASGARRCETFLFLPFVGKACDVPSAVCRVYVRKNSTCSVRDITSKAFSACTKTLIHMDNKKQKEVRLTVQKTMGNEFTASFNLQYKVIDCQQRIAGRRMTKPRSTASLRTEDTITSANTSLPQKPGSQKTGTFTSATAAIVAITVVLAILLIATCVMLVHMYRRKEKAVTFQNPAVVAYVHSGYADDSGCSAQGATDYLEFRGSSVSATASSDSIHTTDPYAETGQRNFAAVVSECEAEGTYQNIPLSSAMTATKDDMVIETSFTPNCTYAEVNKARKSCVETLS